MVVSVGGGGQYGATPTFTTIVRATPDWAPLVYLYVQYVLCIAISHVFMYMCTVFSDRLPNCLNQCIMYGISTLHVSHFVNILYIAMATCYP